MAEIPSLLTTLIELPLTLYSINTHSPIPLPLLPFLPNPTYPPAPLVPVAAMAEIPSLLTKAFSWIRVHPDEVSEATEQRALQIAGTTHDTHCHDINTLLTPCHPLL